MTTPPAFISLPTEILQTVFQYLPPSTLVNVSQTSKQLHAVANTGILWRHYCQKYFKCWNPRHNFTQKLAAPLSEVDWQELFRYRLECEREVRTLLDKVLQKQQGRIACISKIAQYGYDAKEELLRQLACPDNAEDVLARRYYANATLERIHREVAIKVWKDLADGQDVPIEKALAAYDVFTRVGDDADFETVSRVLDQLAAKFLEQTPDFTKLSPRAQAATLANFLRAEGYEGVPDPAYRNLENSFIGIALTSQEHHALPLIQVSIYCALARRVGLDARPCGFVLHFYCMVFAPPRTDMDGNYNPNIGESEAYIYLDPFRSSVEVPESTLCDTLREAGVRKAEYGQFLNSTDVREMVLRTARNIMESVQTIRQNEAQADRELRSAWLDAYPDMDNAFYATLWAMIVLVPPQDDEANSHASPTARRRPYLPYLLEHFQIHYPWDVTLLEKCVIPLFDQQPEGERLMSFVHSMHNIDAMRKQVKRRNKNGDTVKYKVGQLFRHKRYHYEGVITGWDVHCDAAQEWILHMGVDRLQRGREQSFYHVLVCDKTVRYVAEENIDPAPPGPTPSEAMLRLAGRHFKRWDSEQQLFVSNMKDEYADD